MHAHRQTITAQMQLSLSLHSVVDKATGAFHLLSGQ